jgi:hypothetical protein
MRIKKYETNFLSKKNINNIPVIPQNKEKENSPVEKLFDEKLKLNICRNLDP